MKPGERILCGLLAVLLLCILPVAAASVLPATTPDTGSRPSVITEYGTGRDFGLVKVTHIDYAKPHEKPRPAKAANCFKLAGWRWPGPVTYTIASSAGSPLSTAVASASGVWDAQTSRSLFTGSAYASYPFDRRDSVNSVSFGDYADGDVIAVTMTWYYPSTKTAVESDILFDTTYTWGTVDAEHPSVMDLRNLATHEIGHTLGLSDLYSAPCNAVTMFGWADYGETIKRDLAPSDITGLQRIYGL